jgi:hypothetical protein
MDVISKLPHCRKCGKKMKEIVSQKATIPWEIMLGTLAYGVHPSSFWIFECPDKHGGAILIPNMYDESELTTKKRYIVK